MADTPVSMRAYLTSGDTDAAINLTLDFGPSGAIALAMTRFPDEVQIVDTVTFVPMSYADLSLTISDTSDPLVLDGTATAAGNRVELNLEPDDPVMLIRSLEVAPELMIITRFDDGSSAVIRFEFNGAVRDLLRRTRESLQTTP